MKPLALIALATLALAACREETAETILPAQMPADAVGYYCQMLLVHHEGPKAQIHLDGAADPIFLAQVRDTIAYLHMPEQSHAVRAAFVQDMAGAESWAQPAGWIAAEAALYVVGSDRLGGMGAPEFVPFSDAEAAHAFIAKHGGRLLRFDEIAAADVLSDGDAEPDAAGDIAARLGALARPQGHD